MALDLSALDIEEKDEASPLSGLAMRAPLSAFEEDPGNPRFEEDEESFRDLVADVRARGILQPIVVERAAPDRMRIRFGSRRFRAAKAIGLTDVPYVVTEDSRHFDDYAQVSENERRSALQPLELATFIEKKLARGEKKKTIAGNLRIDASAVTHLLALVENPPSFILDLYHSRRCRSPQYLYELRKLSELDMELVSRRCATAGEIDKRFLAGLAATIQRHSRAPQNSAAADAPPDNPQGRRRQKTAGPMLLIRPQLLGIVGSTQVAVDLSLSPSASGMVYVHYSDGRHAEVALASIAFTELCEWRDLEVPDC